MCKRCNVPDEAGNLTKPDILIECSWCEVSLQVCHIGAYLIRKKQLLGICDGCRPLLHNPLDFGWTHSKWHRDEEWDADANGWLSNAIKLLEDAPS